MTPKEYQYYRRETQLRKDIANFLNRWDRKETITETDKSIFLGDAIDLLRTCLDLMTVTR